MEITAADILEQAAEKFETGEYRWFGGTVLPALGGGSVCAAMAIHRLGRAISPNFAFASDHAVHALMKHVNNWSIPAWNDDPERTLDDVIQAMKETAKELRNQS